MNSEPSWETSGLADDAADANDDASHCLCRTILTLLMPSVVNDVKRRRHLMWRENQETFYDKMLLMISWWQVEDSGEGRGQNWKIVEESALATEQQNRRNLSANSKLLLLTFDMHRISCILPILLLLCILILHPLSWTLPFYTQRMRPNISAFRSIMIQLFKKSNF